MPNPLVPRAHYATNALHSLIYFAPETEQHLTGAGLKLGGMCYFAGRSAPMGAVGGGVVAATFYNFNPSLVAHYIPRAWELASPRAVIGARFAAADAALTRLLGPDVIASPEMITLAGLVREAASACRPEGRPLYAAHADLDWPDAPHLVMWHGLSLLREHRGDGHICALVAAGLSGLEAQVSHVATGRGFVPEFGRSSRGWSQDQWDGAIGDLAARGLLDRGGALTEAGQALRAHIEDETDRMAAPPWRHLGDERTEEVVRIGKAMTRAVISAGAFPREGVFASTP
jgi:helix-turn-helix protein